MAETAQPNHDDLLEQVRELRERLASRPLPVRFDLSQKTLDFLRLVISQDPFARPCYTLWGLPLHIDDTLADGAVKPIYADR